MESADHSAPSVHSNQRTEAVDGDPSHALHPDQIVHARKRAFRPLLHDACRDGRSDTRKSLQRVGGRSVDVDPRNPSIARPREARPRPRTSRRRPECQPRPQPLDSRWSDPANPREFLGTSKRRPFLSASHDGLRRGRPDAGKPVERNHIGGVRVDPLGRLQRSIGALPTLDPLCSGRQVRWLHARGCVRARHA